MSWIVGQAGLLYGVCILLLSFVVVVVTSISMSAIATNGEVKNGGIYYLVSLSFFYIMCFFIWEYANGVEN